jgi:hypothetical protein
MGSKTSQSSTAFKRKRLMEQSSGDATLDYFFAKYLTSPELLDLEVLFPVLSTRLSLMSFPC